jgi:hypothetical protein
LLGGAGEAARSAYIAARCFCKAGKFRFVACDRVHEVKSIQSLKMF